MGAQAAWEAAVVLAGCTVAKGEGTVAAVSQALVVAAAVVAAGAGSVEVVARVAVAMELARWEALVAERLEAVATAAAAWVRAQAAVVLC